LPPSLAARIALSRLTRAALRPGTNECFSQFGEDIRLWGLVGQRRPGFYVDVGCNHPVRFSNTFRLYLEGWHGITIDGDPELVGLHQCIRRLDRAVCAVVSDHEEDVAFSVMLESCVSKVAPSADEPAPPGTKCVHRVRAQTLGAILEAEGCPARFDLLSLDIEGHETRALKGLPFERFRPDVIAVEIHGFDVSAPRGSECGEMLLDRGYALDSYFPPTAVFRSAGCLARTDA
jgi:FkbM family methyltransferase